MSTNDKGIMGQRVLIIALTAILLGGCATIPVEEREPLRTELRQNAEKTIQTLVTNNPETQAAVDSAVGYFAGQVRGAKVPVLGAGKGYGVLVDREKNTRTYFDIRRFDVGTGLGAARYSPLILFQDRETMEQLQSGVRRVSVGVEAGAGETAATTVTEVGKGATLHLVGEAGAVVAASARHVLACMGRILSTHGYQQSW